MNPAIRRSVVAFALLLLPTASAAGAGSIFDDDWKPPKASEAPRPTAVKPATPAPADPKSAVTPADPASLNPSPVKPDAAAARRPVPAQPDQAAVRRVLKDVFAAQLADRSPTARKKLTEAMLAQAGKSADAPVDRFVLLAASIDAAGEAGSLPLAFQAADEMGKAFEVDALAVKAESAAKLAPKPAGGDQAADNVRAGLDLAAELVRAEDFAAAARLCATLTPIAAAAPELRAEVQKRQREVAAARDAGERAAKAAEKILATPDDPAANLELGKYLCFFRNDWRAGLHALTRGSDPTLKAVATKEIAGATTPDEQAALAGAWWDAAQAAGASKAAAQAHAAEWYKRAAPDLKGLVKARAEQRIASAVAAQGSTGAPWTVLFRSHDGGIWGTDTNRGANDRAAKMSAAPKDTKWLRLSCAANGKAVIIPMTPDALQETTLRNPKIAWYGKGTLSDGAFHLGIYYATRDCDHRGAVSVALGGGAAHPGWGFGHQHQIGKEQGYAWDCVDLKGPVTFEIAVKAGPLTDVEQKLVLNNP